MTTASVAFFYNAVQRVFAVASLLTAMAFVVMMVRHWSP